MKTASKQPLSKQYLKTLIVAAHASELKPFVDLGKKNFLIKKDVGFLSAGIGPVAATFGLTHFLEDFAPEQIIAVGTAGVIDEKNFKIGDVVSVKSVATASGFEAAYTPKLQSHTISVGAYCNTPLPIPSANTFSPQEITRSASWQKDLIKSGFDVEHLESFAFAFVAKKFRVPIQIFLGLANVVGENAHKEWVKNAESVLKKTARVAKKIM